jgi:hypothetical protein
MFKIPHFIMPITQVADQNKDGGHWSLDARSADDLAI